MRTVRTDQSQVLEVIEAIDQITTPMEDGVQEKLTSAQAGVLLVAVHKLHRWVIDHV